ncbi:MAG: diguanylate cyclase [Magnetococcales bacterium]|nr:diguanylate cyclase [Magnetococcales bacterium]
MLRYLTRFRFKRIGDRVLVLVGVSVLAGLVWMSDFHTRRQEKIITEQHAQTMYFLTRSVNEGLEAIMLAGDAGIAHEYARHLKHIEEIKSFRIMRISGLEAFKDNATILDVNKRLGENEFSPRANQSCEVVLPADDQDLLDVVDSGNQIVKQVIDPANGLPFMTVLAPILNKKVCHRCHSGQFPVRGVVQLTFSMATVAAAIRQTRTQSTLILVMAMVGVLGLTTLLIRRSVVLPIGRVTKAMREITTGNLHHRVPEIGVDELGWMARNFNKMSDELARLHLGLKNEQEKLTTIILSAREGMVVTDRLGDVVLVNPAAERLLEKNREEIVRSGFVHILDDPEYMTALLDGTRENVPPVVVYKGRILNIYAATIHVVSGERIGSAALIRDITQEKKLEQQLRLLSTTDALTGLNNRRRFDEVLIEEWSRSKRYDQYFTLLLFDVDHFKRFNDQYGHDQGDRVLQAIGRIMRELFRDVDHPCRYGGEEFVVILPCTGFPGASLAAERLRIGVESMVIDGLKVTISIGVAIYPGVGTDPTDMVKQADNALYTSKQLGRNRVTYAPGCETATSAPAVSSSVVASHPS